VGWPPTIVRPLITKAGVPGEAQLLSELQVGRTACSCAGSCMSSREPLGVEAELARDLGQRLDGQLARVALPFPAKISSCISKNAPCSAAARPAIAAVTRVLAQDGKSRHSKRSSPSLDVLVDQLRHGVQPEGRAEGALEVRPLDHHDRGVDVAQRHRVAGVTTGQLLAGLAGRLGVAGLRPARRLARRAVLGGAAERGQPQGDDGEQHQAGDQQRLRAGGWGSGGGAVGHGASREGRGGVAFEAIVRTFRCEVTGTR
jgi:hypothetical protein